MTHSKQAKSNFIPIFSGLLIFSLFVFQFTACKQEANLDQIFKDHFQVQDMLLDKRAATDTLSDTQLYNYAIDQYKAEDYIGAAKSYQELAAGEPRSGAFPYFAGMSYLAAGKANEAMPFFQKLLNSERLTRSVQQARWNMALAQILAKDVEGAKKSLAAIKEGDFKHAEAVNLLKQL